MPWLNPPPTYLADGTTITAQAAARTAAATMTIRPDFILVMTAPLVCPAFRKASPVRSIFYHILCRAST